MPTKTDLYDKSLINDDYSIDQGWNDYSADDHSVWNFLYNRQMQLLKGRACDEYLSGITELGLEAEQIPVFDDVNERLMKKTGWQIVAVPGLIPSKPFFDLLANRKFPCGNFMRDKDQLDYLEEPDIFHDVFGHVPPLTNPAYAEYMHEYGKAGERAMRHKTVKNLARLNWFTIEFGLIMKEDGPKIYGAGIASSFGEAQYALDDPSPHYIQFDLERTMRTGYFIDDFQPAYFVIDSFEALFEEAISTDFGPLYESFKTKPDYNPFDIVERDNVIREGTLEYFKDIKDEKMQALK